MTKTETSSGSASAAIVEWWSLRTTEERAIALGDDERKRITTALEEAREHRRAAEILFVQDLLPRALAEAQLAFNRLAEAEGSTPPNADPLPRTDRDVTKAHKELFTTLCEAHDELEDALGPSALTTKRIRTMRLERRLLVLAVVVGLAIALAWLGLRSYVKVTASGHVAHNAPNKVMDLKADVPWLLPPATEGWLDLTPSSARTISRVRVCTAMGASGARNVRLDFFRGGAVVKTIETTLETAGLLYPEWQSVEVGESNIERVRLSVLTWFGAGGGIGEIELN